VAEGTPAPLADPRSAVIDPPDAPQRGGVRERVAVNEHEIRRSAFRYPALAHQNGHAALERSGPAIRERGAA
jgi:hypothetical protein